MFQTLDSKSRQSHITMDLIISLANPGDSFFLNLWKITEADTILVRIPWQSENKVVKYKLSKLDSDF